MQNQLKKEKFYNCDEEIEVQHDAHIRTYESQNLGIKVVFCDSRGVPVADSVAPISSYMPNTSFNM